LRKSLNRRLLNLTLASKEDNMTDNEIYDLVEELGYWHIDNDVNEIRKFKEFKDFDTWEEAIIAWYEASG